MDYFWSPNKAYGRRKEKKRKEKKRKRKIKPRYGCLTLIWIFVWNSQVLCESPCNCMVRSLSQNLGLGFRPNQSFLESRVGKTLNGTR